MRKTGPPKKPTHLKLLHNTLRADTVPANEPKPDVEIPLCPEHLSVEAKAEWARVAQELFTLKLLAKVDRAALSAYCSAWTFAMAAERHCFDAQGNVQLLLKTAAGNFIENPYFSAWKRASEIMHKFLTEFGMTPASRSRINVLVDESPINAKPSNKNYA